MILLSKRVADIIISLSLAALVLITWGFVIYAGRVTAVRMYPQLADLSS